MTTYTIPAELLQELISNCMASIAEDGISDARRVYRTELHHRANLAMKSLQPNTQEPCAWVGDSPTKGNGEQLFWTKAQAHAYASSIWPLYTHPVPQAKPLTTEEVEQILAQHVYEIHGDRARYIVRMTEQAHNIGVKP